MAKVKSVNSEVDAYVFIKQTLDELRWNTRNPSRHPEGQVYTQGECLTHPEIKKGLGQEKPENIVKVTETKFWVIEAKREHSQEAQALKEAREYALKVNKASREIKVVLVSGVVGNRTDSYIIKTEYFDGHAFKPVTINGKEASGLLSPLEAREIIQKNDPNLKDVVIDEKLFLKKAEAINEILHNGAINKNQRAKIMAALLLSLIDDTQPNVDASPRGLMRDINSRVENVLEAQGKTEFKELIKITLPPSPDNHFKFKKALVATIQELNLLNIRSAMNSRADVLGKFYEVFLKYGNGAKEIGIVLTPRHITKFAVEAMNVSVRDIVFDPTCGTGGFLVAAFDHVKKEASPAQIDVFKKNNLFGIEQEPEVVALALVNMIFRGDGKNNIIEGNCFQKNLITKREDGVLTAGYTTDDYEEGKQVVSKVLMNPPFALKSGDEKEYKFIDYALKQLQQGGLLFSVLPYSCMVKGGAYLEWRRQLLQDHTLLSVVTFPEDLFYPIGVHSLGLFLKRGVPHPSSQKVLWIRAVADGYQKSKGKRLESSTTKDDFPASLSVIQGFLINQGAAVKNIVRRQKATPVDLNDENLELVPEAYLDQEATTADDVRREAEKILRETASFIVKNGRD